MAHAHTWTDGGGRLICTRCGLNRGEYEEERMPRLPETLHGLRPLLTTPDELGPCQQYCELLKEEIWRMDRRWAQLRANVADADRMGKRLDIEDQLRHLEVS